VLALLFAGVLCLDRVAGVSALIGGCASLFPNAYFALRVFGRRSDRIGTRPHELAGQLKVEEVRRIATGEAEALYRAEAGKLAAMAVVLILAFGVVEPLNAGALIGGFVLTHLAHVMVMFGSNLVER